MLTVNFAADVLPIALQIAALIGGVLVPYSLLVLGARALTWMTTPRALRGMFEETKDTPLRSVNNFLMKVAAACLVFVLLADLGKWLQK